MSKETMKLAQLAINNLIASSHATDPQHWRDARQDAVTALAAIDKALAEQPAQQEPVATLFGSLPVYDTSPPAQRKIPQNCGTGYCSCIECLKEPAAQQQEPVAWRWVNSKGWLTYGEQPHDKFASTPLYTFPPAQRTWVGLTDEEVINVMPDDDTPISLGEAFSKFAELIEAKLKEKNT